MTDDEVRAEIRRARERRVAAERQRVLGLLEPKYDPSVAEREKAKAEAKRLKAQEGTKVRTDVAGRLMDAQRLDVFELLHQRKDEHGEPLLPDASYHAARRLEADMHTAAGAEGTLERVEFISGGGCAERITQRMIDAAERVHGVRTGQEGVLTRVGIRDARLLRALLEPPLAGILTRWRETVQAITGETNDRGQTACVRSACANLAEAYVAIDYPATHKPLTATYV